MTPAEVLIEAFSRVPEVAKNAVEGLSVEHLAHRPDSEANSIAWLVWHLARAQDAQVAPLADVEQVWTSAGWDQRFALPFETSAMGYGQSSAEVGQVRVPAELLAGYLDAVHQSSLSYLRALAPADLDRVINADVDPVVTVGIRLVSVVDDCVQHAGQASYVRGLLDRAS